MANEKRMIKLCDATAVYNGIALYMAENAYLNDTALDVLKMVASWLDKAPEVDAVEVCRCKDCKYYDNSEGIQWCHLNSKFFPSGLDWHCFPEDGFCSYGERRNNEPEEPV